jgi:biopolymer transport protein ExbD
MSGSVGGGEDKMELNLTPLLDVVLQLVMFFMMCANFIQEQVNETVRLPEAGSAAPMERIDVPLLFLNVLKSGDVEILGNLPVPFKEQAKIEAILKGKYNDALALARSKNPGAKSVDTMLIIRADKEATFAQVYTVMRAAKSQNFHKIQLRAQMTAK